MRNTLISRVIRHFEFVYELSHEHFRNILRLAGERGIIADVPAWIEYRKLRNTTSHTYNADRAESVLRSVPVFLTHAQALLAQLMARNV